MENRMDRLAAQRRKAGRLCTLAVLAATFALFATVAPAQAQFDIAPGSFKAGAWEDEAQTIPETQAGAAPFVASTGFAITTHQEPGLFGPVTVPDSNLKGVEVDLPPGLVADPNATPKCPREALATAGTADYTPCPPSTQVGQVIVRFAATFGVPNDQMYPVYNVEPRKGDVADFAFSVNGLGTTHVVGDVRSDGDFELTTRIKDISSYLQLLSTELWFWGVPADPIHDGFRGRFCANFNFCIPVSPGVSSGSTPRPFLRNPTECDGRSPVTRIRIASWAEPAVWKSASAASPPVTGCDRLPFAPTLEATPDASRARAPTGLDVSIDIPQNTDVGGLATAHLKDAAVTLPEGMTINPSVASGLVACPDSSLRLRNKAPVTCPAASRLGTASATTPVLDETLSGGIYIRSQASMDPESGEMYRIALVLESAERGLSIRLPGSIRADARSGRLTTTFENNPRLPVSTIDLAFKSGARAPLTTPSSCGVHAIGWRLTSWGGQEITGTQPFTIDEGCGPVGFVPSFAAGAVNPSAASYSPFVVQVGRDMGQKELGRINVRMPEGVAAKLPHVELCTDEQLAAAAGRSGRATYGAAACPVASQIGTVTVGAGAGMPYVPRLPGTDVSGRVFLTEAYTQTRYDLPGAGAPRYGLAIEVPAVAGPFDLGTVIVRAAIYVDSDTAQLTVLSDQLPRILNGVPLDLRDVRVSVDRDGFMVNPTDCAEQRVGGDIRAQDNTAALRDSRFQVGGCGDLDLSPRVAMRLVGRKQTKLGGNPALRVRLRQGEGQSNLGAVRAVMPRTIALDGDNAAGDWLCDYEQGLEASCPAESRIGKATAVSPLLKEPLTGPVYFVKHVRFDKKTGSRIRTLPTLLVKLDGEVAINLRAKSNVRNGRLVTRFVNVPDAAVSRFQLNLRGGDKRGILTVTGKGADLCKGRQVAKLGIRGQNGAIDRQKVRMRTPCAKKRKRAAKAKRRAAAKRRVARRNRRT